MKKYSDLDCIRSIKSLHPYEKLIKVIVCVPSLHLLQPENC
jgi:hypothetical protein